MNVHASFKSLQENVNEDWQLILSEFGQFAKGLPDRVMAHLKLLEGDFGGFPVDRYTHSLQTATRAIRGGRDDEYVVCALLHDIGDKLGTYNHPDVAAAILKPFVSEANLWMIQHHNIFQGYYFFHHIGMDRNMREQFVITFISIAQPSFVSCTTAPLLMPKPIPCPSANSSPCCAKFLPVR